MSIIRGTPLRGRPDLYRGEGEATFWEVMGFFAPRPPEIGLRALIRRLVGEERYADAYIAAIYWDACFDPGPPPPEGPPARERRAAPPARRDVPRKEVAEPGPPEEDWRKEG